MTKMLRKEAMDLREEKNRIAWPEYRYDRRENGFSDADMIPRAYDQRFNDDMTWCCVKNIYFLSTSKL